MPNVEKQRERLISLLKELFQLDQPDLDFGFYRIMHAKAQARSRRFIEHRPAGHRARLPSVYADEVAESRIAGEG
jgi:hypothetical protein